MTTTLAIAGAAGRMGRALVAAVQADARFRLVGASEHRGDSAVGSKVGGVCICDDAAVASNGADVWIDFTTPDATVAALESLGAGAAVIGTTGLSPMQESLLRDAANRLPIVRSGNFSLGVNLLIALVEQAAAKLGPEWDVEITEAHHRRKVDAPSGTALMLGEAAASGRGKTLAEVRSAPRDGMAGPRSTGSIGFSVIRAGGIVGDHDVRFASDREVVALSHHAIDRSLFADGALAAAHWVKGKAPGLYTMRDVLGF